MLAYLLYSPKIFDKIHWQEKEKIHSIWDNSLTVLQFLKMNKRKYFFQIVKYRSILSLKTLTYAIEVFLCNQLLLGNHNVPIWYQKLVHQGINELILRL